VPDYVRLSIRPTAGGEHTLTIYNPSILPPALTEQLTALGLTLRMEGEEVPSSVLSGSLRADGAESSPEQVTKLIRDHGLAIFRVPGSVY
jgi:hypothetical protein